MPREEKTCGDRGNCQKTDTQGSNLYLLSDRLKERGAGGFRPQYYAFRVPSPGSGAICLRTHSYTERTTTDEPCK